MVMPKLTEYVVIGALAEFLMAYRMAVVHVVRTHIGASSLDAETPNVDIYNNYTIETSNTGLSARGRIQCDYLIGALPGAIINGRGCETSYAGARAGVPTWPGSLPPVGGYPASTFTIHNYAHLVSPANAQ